MSETSTATAICHCDKPIHQVYTGTFWKAPDPMPMMWVHVTTNARACGWAEPARAREPESDGREGGAA